MHMQIQVNMNIVTTDSPYQVTTTIKHVYVRGHKVHVDHTRTSKPNIQHSDGLEPPSAAHNARMKGKSDSEKESEKGPQRKSKDTDDIADFKHLRSDSPVRDKKHTMRKETKFYNYKMLQESTKVRTCDVSTPILQNTDFHL